MPIISTARLVAKIEADFEKFHGLEVIKYREYDEGGNFDYEETIGTEETPYCLPKTVKQDMIINGELIHQSRIQVFLILVKRWTNVQPREGGVIVDKFGTLWAIKIIQIRTLRTRYRLVCVKV